MSDPVSPSSTPAAKLPHWFILCGARMWEEQARQLLVECGFRAFVPLRPASRMSKTGKVILRSQPLLSGWVFVYATWQELEDFKRFVQHRHGKKLYYHVRRETLRPVGATNRAAPITRNRITTISEEEMERFITFCTAAQDDLRFFTPEEVKLKAGDRVRVIGGPFNGQEGYFLKTAGKRSKSLVIELPGCILAATTTVLPELIQVLERRKG